MQSRALVYLLGNRVGTVLTKQRFDEHTAKWKEAFYNKTTGRIHSIPREAFTPKTGATIHFNGIMLTTYFFGEKNVARDLLKDVENSISNEMKSFVAFRTLRPSFMKKNFLKSSGTFRLNLEKKRAK